VLAGNVNEGSLRGGTGGTSRTRDDFGGGIGGVKGSKSKDGSFGRSWSVSGGLGVGYKALFRHLLGVILERNERMASVTLPIFVFVWGEVRTVVPSGL
jgi:hypothetical protein